MEQILNSYYADNAKKLHGMIDKILFKLHFINIDKDDFYSLGIFRWFFIFVPV